MQVIQQKIESSVTKNPLYKMRNMENIVYGP